MIDPRGETEPGAFGEPSASRDSEARSPSTRDAAGAGRCWVEIDRAALLHNVAAVRNHLPANVQVMAVVKANAYGHGLEGVAIALRDAVQMFGVADVREALELRACLPAAPIYILGPALPEERAQIAANGFVPAISTIDEAVAYNALAGATPLAIHVDIDTGMGRIGIWHEDALATVQAIQRLRGVHITGIASHLPSADEDDAFTARQLAEFARLTARLRAAGLADAIVHVENSAGLIAFPAEAGDMVRAGLMLYGCAPRPEFQALLQPVLSWKTRITLVREIGVGRSISYGRTYVTSRPMRIATLGVGYADGYSRHLSNRGAEVLIRGGRCPVLGRVTMDQIMVDVTGVAGASTGDEAVLIGTQATEEIPVRELAQKAGTIAWDVFTGIGSRVARVFR